VFRQIVKWESNVFKEARIVKDVVLNPPAGFVQVHKMLIVRKIRSSAAICEGKEPNL
jgi:hypothetical protein